MEAEVDYVEAMMTDRNKLKNGFTTFSMFVSFQQSVQFFCSVMDFYNCLN